MNARGAMDLKVLMLGLVARRNATLTNKHDKRNYGIGCCSEQYRNQQEKIEW